MGEADGHSGLNKIQVPPYSFPRERQGLLFPGASLTIEDWIFAHICSLNPFNQPCNGPLSNAPFIWVWGGDGLVAGDVGMGDPVLPPALVSRQHALGCWPPTPASHHRWWVELEGTSPEGSPNIGQSFQLGSEGLQSPDGDELLGAPS